MNTYPLKIEGSLDEPLSRWRWLVKWFLALPHAFLLIFLWIGMGLAMLFWAFWVLLFTGRYPRAVFDYNVRVLRWTWRVQYYATSGLATDRYPPFHGRPDPDYPATLEIPYPEQQRRGLPLIGWWLAGIPQYVIGGLIGGGLTYGFHNVLAILALVAGVCLLFGGRYPRDLYDLVMGCNRYAMRATVYSLFMTREYPPFRLDQGGLEAPASGQPLPGPDAAGAAA